MTIEAETENCKDSEYWVILPQPHYQGLLFVIFPQHNTFRGDNCLYHFFLPSNAPGVDLCLERFSLSGKQRKSQLSPFKKMAEGHSLNLFNI